MQILTTYNSIASGFDIPTAEAILAPHSAYGVFDDFRILTEWDGLRGAATNGGTAAVVANSIYGEVALTPGTAAGPHLQMKTMSFLPAAGKPLFMLARVKAVTAGKYYIGISNTATAQDAVVLSGNALAAGRGAGFLIQTTNAIDVISRDGTTDVRNQSVATLSAATYTLFGIALYTNTADFYINNKKVSSIALAAGVGTTGYTPQFEAATLDNTKILTVDFVSCAQER
jgi:hypothetical protein